MPTSESVLTEFYQAFKDLDAEKMVSFYSDDVIFEDPAFGRLKGERAKNMWRMLIASQKDQTFIVDFNVTSENSVKWEAQYTFSKTGRPVHNHIEAQFELKNGLIVQHKDHFNLHNWAKQALGFTGSLLGGTKFFKRKLQAQTNRLLDKYESKTQ